MSRRYESVANKKYVCFMKQDLKQYVNCCLLGAIAQSKLIHLWRRQQILNTLTKLKRERHIYNSKH